MNAGAGGTLANEMLVVHGPSVGGATRLVYQVTLASGRVSDLPSPDPAMAPTVLFVENAIEAPA